MKRASISIDILIVIIIAVIAMSIFLIFFTGRSASLFGQVKEISPSEEETAKDACQIVCNQAKIRKDCSDWCSKISSIEIECYKLVPDCSFKKADGTACSCPE